MPWLEDLITVLEADGVGVYGSTIFKGSAASVPMLASGATLVLMETGGSGPENTQNSTQTPAYLRPTAQLSVRANTRPAARAMAEAAYLSLFKIRNQHINSGWYQFVRPLQEPFDGGVDDRKQVRIVFNVTGKCSLGRVL